MAEADMIIFSYVLFIGFIGFLASMGGPGLLAGAPAAPAAPDISGLLALTAPGGSGLDWIAAIILIPIQVILFGLSELVYFVSLIAITAIAFPFLGIVIAAFSVVVIMAVIGMAKPGGGK